MPAAAGMQLAAAFTAGCAVTAAASAALLFLRAPHRRARHVRPPHRGWEAPSPQPPPFDAAAMHVVDPATAPVAELYPLVISAVVPRPVGFVASLAADGSPNLAPYSYFNVLSHNPPLVALGICRSPGRSGGKKDTLQNIEETGEFTINIMSEWFVEAANHTCGDYDRGVDEFKVSGLTPVPSSRVAPPRVRESGVQLECRLRQVLDFQDRQGKDTVAIVLGEVVLFHIAEGVAGRSPSGKLVVDPVKLAPVCRLGGFTYGRVTELYDIGRPNKQGQYGSSTPAPAPAAAASTQQQPAAGAEKRPQ